MSADITRNFHGGNRESTEAHRSIVSTKESLRRRVIAYVRARGDLGATSDEIEVGLGLPHQTVSARITEAKAGGELVPSGVRRPTRSGRNASVLVVAPDGSVPVEHRLRQEPCVRTDAGGYRARCRCGEAFEGPDLGAAHKLVVMHARGR